MNAKRILLGCVALALIGGASAPVDAAFTPFDDHFTQWTDDGRWDSGWAWNSVGNANWRQAGHANGRTVSDGLSAMNIQARADYHLTYIYTNRNDFDFFSQALTVEWTIDTANTLIKPTVEPSESWGSQTASLSILNTIPFNELDLDGTDADASSKASDAGADIRILMRERGLNGIVDWYYTLQGQEIDAVPTKITAVYDATNIAITLEGATFTSTSSNTYNSAHGLTAADFAAGYTMRVFTTDTSKTGNESPSGVSTDRITVTAVPEPAVLGMLGLGGLMLMRRKR